MITIPIRINSQRIANNVLIYFFTSLSTCKTYKYRPAPCRTYETSTRWWRIHIYLPLRRRRRNILTWRPPFKNDETRFPAPYWILCRNIYATLSNKEEGSFSGMPLPNPLSCIDARSASVLSTVAVIFRHLYRGPYTFLRKGPDRIFRDGNL